MNDRFRFRAWNRKTQKMEYDILGYIEVCEIFHNEKPEYSEVMQSTGLRDKNDKLIYEGDVLCIHLYNDDDNLRLVVKFGHGTWESGFYNYQGFYLEDMNSRSDGYANFLFDNRIEVIGNKFQNPELLKKP